MFRPLSTVLEKAPLYICMEPLVRYKSTWYKIVPKPYEPSRQTYEIAWMKIRDTLGYVAWFKKERNISKILYNE